MPNKVDVATINTLVAGAADLVAAGDYQQAEIDLVQAQTLLAAIPNTEGVDNKLEFDRESLHQSIENVRALRGSDAGKATGGVRRTSVTYARVSN